jgi:Outer membrane protein beta-barrel domain
MNLMMKKTALGLILLAALGGVARAAIRFEVGLLGGTRTVNSADIKAVYGSGLVYYPYLAVHAWKGLFVGAGYEGGYSRKGTIGIYEEPTTLRVGGFEVFVGYEIEAGTVSPYVKAGYARYSYKQTIDSPFIGDQAADANKWTPMFGGGLKIPLSGALFMAGEIRFVPLKVKPFEDEVDLGGIRYMAGFGLKF